MVERDAAALDNYRLLPRLLRDVDQVDTGIELAGLQLKVPMLSLATTPPAQPAAGAVMVPARLLLEQPHLYHPQSCIALLPTGKMGALIESVRSLARLGVAAVALDQSILADIAPFGNVPWRPRSREELAELRAAAGGPFWLYGVCCADDADVALEAGLEAVVVHNAAARHLGGPAVIEVLPEILDAVAGTMSVYAAGLVRNGVDVFRLLAVGAEAVMVESDRTLASLEAELHYAMRLTGCASVADIGFQAIFAPLFEDGAA